MRLNCTSLLFAVWGPMALFVTVITCVISPVTRFKSPFTVTLTFGKIHGGYRFRGSSLVSPFIIVTQVRVNISWGNPTEVTVPECLFKGEPTPPYPT